jgi:hypothetical protein
MASAREPIGVIGTGYVGLVTAAGFAEIGHDVWCIDIDAQKVGRLRRGEVPIYEPGLEELVRRHRERLRFSTDIAEALEHARLLFVAVGTPPTYSGDADLDALNHFRSPAHVRLILEEFFLFQLGLARRQRGLRAERKGTAFEITDKTREVVKRILPFPLTGAQKRVLREIADDLRSPHPMNRLVQGDVGSGKTMVALLSMVVALEQGAQAAFMAPTEILAEQHYLTFRRLLARCSYNVELLTSARKGKDRKAALARLLAGEAPARPARACISKREKITLRVIHCATCLRSDGRCKKKVRQVRR